MRYDPHVVFWQRKGNSYFPCHGRNRKLHNFDHKTCYWGSWDMCGPLDQLTCSVKYEFFSFWFQQASCFPAIALYSYCFPLSVKGDSCGFQWITMVGRGEITKTKSMRVIKILQGSSRGNFFFDYKDIKGTSSVLWSWGKTWKNNPWEKFYPSNFCQYHDLIFCEKIYSTRNLEMTSISHL